MHAPCHSRRKAGTGGSAAIEPRFGAGSGAVAQHRGGRHRAVDRRGLSAEPCGQRHVCARPGATERDTQQADSPGATGSRCAVCPRPRAGPPLQCHRPGDPALYAGYRRFQCVSGRAMATTAKQALASGRAQHARLQRLGRLWAVAARRGRLPAHLPQHPARCRTGAGDQRDATVAGAVCPSVGRSW